MSIVIVSDVADYHAESVRWALEKTDIAVYQWEGLGYEDARQATIRTQPTVQVQLGDRRISPADTVWMRRPLPFSLNPQLAPIDHRFARSEAGRFADCLWAALEMTGCRLINPHSASWAINKKLVQLSLAAQVGLTVPGTVMSNAPSEILAFMNTERERHIYKGFQPHLWENHKTGVTAFVQTVSVSPSEIEDETLLTFTPGIYQARVEKVADIRVMVMGKLIRAFKIVSQSLDWRIDAAYGRASLTEVDIPNNVSISLLEFMQRAKIVFGCFDFALSESGIWSFLEVNESGQFLWIDDMLPSARVFQDFLSFISGEDASRFPQHSEFSFDLSRIPERKRERPAQVTVEVAA